MNTEQITIDALIHPDTEREYYLEDGETIHGCLSIPVRWTGERWETLDGLAITMHGAEFSAAVRPELSEEAIEELGATETHEMDLDELGGMDVDLSEVYHDRERRVSLEDRAKGYKVHSGADAYDSIERDPVPEAFLL